MAVSMCVTLQRSAREVSAYACWCTFQHIPALQHSLSAVDMPAVYYILCVFGQIFPSIWRNTHFLKLRTNLREHPTATLDSRLELASEKTQKSAAAIAKIGVDAAANEPWISNRKDGTRVDYTM